MNAFFSGVGGSALLFAIALVSGVWLSHSGYPYPSLVFTVHKLIAVGTVFVVVRNIYRVQQAAPLRAFVGPGALLITGLLFIALIVSGGLLSLQSGGLLNLPRPLHESVHLVHRVSPLLALMAAGFTFWLLPGARMA